MTIEDVRAVVVFREGIEISFRRQAALFQFVEKVSSVWNVESEHKKTVLVTLSPRVGSGHVLVSDGAVLTAIERFGKVVKAKRCVFPEFPSIETGVRQFLVEVAKPLPSSFQFGRAGFIVAYKGRSKLVINAGRRVTSQKAAVL